MLRRRVFISGRVQGVYFRMHMQEAAQGMGVTGWVRNRRDGRVEAVLEGKEENIEKMLRWCWQGPPSSRVENVEIIDEGYQGEFTDFKIMPTV